MMVRLPQFLISKWYKRSELSQRTALLSCGNLISNAFGSLIASGILDGMEGKLGYAAWRYVCSPSYMGNELIHASRWLFFVEGTLTVVVAICAIFILPDFPETTTGWLTTAEQALAVRRMVEEAAGSSNKGATETKGGHMDGLHLAVNDWKVWWLALGLTSMVVSLSFNAYFPTLSETMGYDRTLTLLLCAPPWLFATVAAFVWSRYERCAFLSPRNSSSLADILTKRVSDVGTLLHLSELEFLDSSSPCQR